MPYTISYTEALREQTKRALDIPTDAPDAMKTWGVYVLAGAGNMNLPEDMRQNPSDTLAKLQEVYRTHSIKPILSDDFEDTEALWNQANAGGEDAQGAWDELAKRSRESGSRSIWQKIDEEGALDGGLLEQVSTLLDEGDREDFLRWGKQAEEWRATLATTSSPMGATPAVPLLAQVPYPIQGEDSARFDALMGEAKKRLAARRHVERVRRKNSFAMLASIQPDLSDDAKAIIDRAIANDWEIAEQDEAAFLPGGEQALPQEQMDLVSAFMAYGKPTDGSGAWMQFFKRAGDTMGQVFTHSGQQLGDIVTGRVARREEYKNVLYQRAILEQLNATNFADLGMWKNSFAEAGNIAGYWAPMILEAVATRGLGALSSARWLARMGTAGRAISSVAGVAGKAAPWLGHYMFTADFQQQFMQRVVLDGGDPTAPETQLMMGIGAFAANLVEHVQWGNFTGKIGMAEIQAQAYSRLTHNILARLGVKVGTQWGTMTVGKALGHVLLHSGMMVFTEAMEEALQQAIEETMVDLGSGRSVRLGNLMEQSVGAFTSTIGPMAWTAILGLPFRAKSAATMHNLDQGAIERLMSASERLKNLAAQGKLTDGREDVAALNQLMFAVTHAANAKEAVNEMLRRGFSWEQANSIVENFQSIQREAIERGQLGELGENVLPTQEELERTGWQVTPNDDGTLSATRDIETEDGKRRRQTLNIRRIASQAVDILQDEQAASTLNYLREQGPAARATYAALGIDLNRSNEEILSDPDARNALALVAARENLRTAGDTRQTETRQAQDAQGNAIEEDVFDVTLAEQATRQTIFHEVSHAVAKTLRNMGLTEKEIDAIQNWRSGREGRDASERDMALPELSSESWNEERVGDEMGDVLAGADEASKGRVAKAMNFIGDLVRRVLRIQKRQAAFRDAVAVMEEVVRSGHWGNIDDLTDAQKRLLAEARQKRAEASARQDNQQPSAQAAENATPSQTPQGESAEQGPSQATEGPSSEEKGTKLARAIDKFCFDSPLDREEMAELAASGQVAETDIYETGYRWDPSLGCWRVWPECRNQPFDPNGPYMGLDGKWRGDAARKAVAGRHSLVALQEIASGKEYGILHNDRFGEIRYPLGKAGKGGLGFLHIVEHRMNGGASLGEAIETAIRVGMAAEIGEETFSKYNTHHLDADGVRAIIAVMPDNTIVITGYEIDADETAAANRRAEEHNPHPHVSSDEVIKRLQETLAHKLAGNNSENQERHQVSPRLPSPEFAMDGTIADALPAHLREDARAIIAERANTPAWMVEPDWTPTDLNERDWLRREAEARHEAGRRFAISGAAPTVEERAEAQRQYDAVVARFTNPDGTKKPGWMKAPNGQPTRLTERQWVQVRTDNFKRWFGDWEAVANATLRNTATSYAKARELVSGLIGRELESADGIKAALSRASLDKIFSGKAVGKSVSVKAHLAAAANIEQLFLASVELKTDKGNRAGIKKMHRLFAPFLFEGQTLVAKLSVKEFEREAEGGNRLYTIEAMEIESAAGDLVPKQAENGESNPTQPTTSILRQLAQKVNSDSASKIVDENGEPLVVWHFTSKGGFGAFDRRKGTPTNLGFHFGSERAAKAIQDKEEVVRRHFPRRGWKPELIPAYLSIQNPLRMKDVFGSYTRTLVDGVLEAMKDIPGVEMERAALEALATDYTLEGRKRNGRKIEKACIALIKAGGFDGIVYQNEIEGGGDSWIAFESEQVKHATVNIGTFDGGNADIRYQIAGRAGAERLGIRGLGDAEAMERSGATREEIAQETGWRRDGNGEWHSVVPRGAQKEAGTEYPDAGAEIGGKRFAVGSKRRAEYERLLAKHRPDLDAGKVLAELDKYGSTRKEKAALHWVIRGTVILPEDEYKVDDALAVAEKAKVDPMAYGSPMELLQAHKEFRPPTHGPIDPDTVPELSDKRDMGYGITTYLVQDDEAGQKAMREILNAAYGKAFSPWCLLHGDGKGGLSSQAWGYWHDTYNSLPKRVAFQNGKPIAFMAVNGNYRNARLEESFEADTGLDAGSHPARFKRWVRENGYTLAPPEQWWDTNDNSHEGIPALVPVEGDPLGRVHRAEIQGDGTIEDWPGGWERHSDGIDEEWVGYSYTRKEKTAGGQKKTTWYFSGGASHEETIDMEDTRGHEIKERLVGASLQPSGVFQYLEGSREEIEKGHLNPGAEANLFGALQGGRVTFAEGSLGAVAIQAKIDHASGEWDIQHKGDIGEAELRRKFDAWREKFEALMTRPADSIGPEERNGRDNGDGRDGKRYSIQAFADGTRFVHVDTDQALFDNAKEKDYPKIARRIILNRFRGKVVGGEKPQNAYVKTETAGEFAYPAKPLPREENSAKMRSAGELGNLLAVGEFSGHKPDDGTHPEATGGWDYYNTIFEVGGKFFAGKVNILINKRGRVFHDVTGVKENSQGLKGQHGEPRALFPASDTQGNIAQHGEPRGESLGAVQSQPPARAEVKSEGGGDGRKAVEGRVRAFDDVPRYSPRGTMAALATLSYIAGQEPNAEHLEEVGRRLGAEGFEVREVMAEAKTIHDGILGKLMKKENRIIEQVAQRVGNAADMKPGEVAEIVAGAVQALHPEDLVREAYMRGAGAQDWAQGTRGAALNALVRQARGDNYADTVAEVGVDATGVLHRMILERPPKTKAEGEVRAAGDGAAQEKQSQVVDVGPQTQEVYEAAAALTAQQEENLERALTETREEMERRREEQAERESRESDEARQDDSGDTGDDDDGGDVDENDHGGEADSIQIPVEMLERNLVNARDPATFACLLRKITRNRILKANGMGTDFDDLDEAHRVERELWANPTNVAMFAKSMGAILRDMANRMLEHSSGAYTALIRKAALLPHYDSADVIELEMQWAVRTLAGASIRQTSGRIVNQTRATLKQYIGPVRKGEHAELEDDLARKITGHVREMAKWYRRVLSMSEGQIASRRDGWTDKDGKHHDGLKDTLDKRGRSLEEAGMTSENERENDAVFSMTAWKLAVLNQYGGTRYLLPAEARERCVEIETWMAKEALKQAQKIEALARKYEADRKTIIDGCAVIDPVTGEKRIHEQDTKTEAFWRATVNTINQRLRYLFARAGGKIGQAAQELIRRTSLELSRGTTRYLREKQEMRRDLVLAVRSVVGRRGVRAWLRRMTTEIPEEHSVALSRQGYRHLTYGQVMHLYGYLRQTATYGENISRHGRDGQRDYIEQHVLTPEDLKILNLMMKIYADRRSKLDEASRDITGFPMLNPDPFFLPVKIKTPTKGGLETTVSTVQAMPDVFSERRKHGLDVDEQADIMVIFHDRMEKTARVLGFGRTGLDIIHTFGNAKVKEAITEARGAKFTHDLIAHFTDWMNGGRPRLTNSEGEDEAFLNGLRTAAVYQALWGNMLSAFKQTLSSPVFLLAREINERGIFQDMAGRFTDGWKQAKVELTQSEPWKARYGDVGIMQETQEAVIGAGEGSLWQSLLRSGMAPLQWGDQRPAILCQVTAYMVERDRLVEQGMDYEEAKRIAADKAMQEVEWTQQSSRAENLPRYSRRGGSGKRMLMMFASSPMLQAGWEVQRIVEWREKRDAFGNGSKEAREAQAALWRTVIVNHVVMPILFQAATMIFNGILGKKEPDKDDLLELIFSMMIGPFARLAFWGGTMKAGYDAATGRGIYGRNDAVPSMIVNNTRNVVDVVTVPIDIYNDGMDAALADLDRFLKRNLAPYRHARKAWEAWGED